MESYLLVIKRLIDRIKKGILGFQRIAGFFDLYRSLQA